MIELDIKKILERNPQIDEQTLRRYREALEQLRKCRTFKKHYDLASPADLVRITPSDENAADSRTIDLSFLNVR